MSVTLLQVTIGAAAAQPTRFTATYTPACQVIIESDDGNGAACWIGDADMATDGSEGIRLTNSATEPGRVVIGPFSAVNPVDLANLYVVGTEGQKINVLYVQH